MFRYNPNANYQPNGGRYLQILSGKDLYKQTIVVSARTHDDTFPVRFPNIFVDYPLEQMHVAHVIYGMGQEVLFLKIEKISINYWFLRPYTYNLVKTQILGNFK